MKYIKYIVILLIVLLINISVKADTISCVYYPIKSVSGNQAYTCELVTKVNFYTGKMTYSFYKDVAGSSQGMSKALYNYLKERGSCVENIYCTEVFPESQYGHQAECHNGNTHRCFGSYQEAVFCAEDSDEIYRYNNTSAFVLSGYNTCSGMLYREFDENDNYLRYNGDSNSTSTVTYSDENAPSLLDKKCCDANGNVRTYNSVDCEKIGMYRYTEQDGCLIPRDTTIRRNTCISDSQTFYDFKTFFNEKILLPLRIAAVVIFLILTTVDYSKVIFDKEASPKKANTKLFKRIIALLLVFFVNEIVNFITYILDWTC